MHITFDLIARADRFFADFHAARMEAAALLPGNPFGVEVRRFGSGVAVKVRHPLLGSKNRMIGFQPDDLKLLDELISFYRADGLRFTLMVPPSQITPTLFLRLVQAGLWSEGSGTVPAILSKDILSKDILSKDILSKDIVLTPSEVTIRRSEPEEKNLYLDLFQQAFVEREESAPGYRMSRRSSVSPLEWPRFHSWTAPAFSARWGLSQNIAGAAYRWL